MKRYIKSAVIQDIYLKDWLAKHKDYPYILCLDDRTPYTGEWEYLDWCDESYIDCPGIVFRGTLDELLSGGGENLLADCYGPEEYQERLDNYYIVKESEADFNGTHEIWLEVMSE